MHKRLVKPCIPIPLGGARLPVTVGSRTRYLAGELHHRCRSLRADHLQERGHEKAEDLEMNQASLDNIPCKALRNPREYIVESGWGWEETSECADSPGHCEDGSAQGQWGSPTATTGVLLQG